MPGQVTLLETSISYNVLQAPSDARSGGHWPVARSQLTLHIHRRAFGSREINCFQKKEQKSLLSCRREIGVGRKEGGGH